MNYEAANDRLSANFFFVGIRADLPDMVIKKAVDDGSFVAWTIQHMQKTAAKPLTKNYTNGEAAKRMQEIFDKYAGYFVGCRDPLLANFFGGEGGGKESSLVGFMETEFLGCQWFRPHAEIE